MFEKELPARPNLEQYKKQARELVREYGIAAPDALARVKKQHPRFYRMDDAELSRAKVSITDAQLVIAREHGFDSWPKFSKHIETLRILREVEDLDDPVAAFIEVACVPLHSGHGTGTLEHAEMILERYPAVAGSNVHVAAILADEAGVREWLRRDPGNATAKGGPRGWDALTHLCFSRYLRIDKERSEAFVRTARALLDAGAIAQTGFIEMIDHPNPRPILESAIYGAAGVARHVELTRLLLERGADPNDEETPYHIPETYDNEVLRVVLESGKLNQQSLATILLRKADWHDGEGLKLALAYGADPNRMTFWGNSALHAAILRDNGLQTIVPLLDAGADPALVSDRQGRTATALAAWRGRGDVLRLLEERGFAPGLTGADALIAACALGDCERAREIAAHEPALVEVLLVHGGTLLALFAGTGNAAGTECLIELGIPVDALFREGDGYYGEARNSTALHVAAWRGRPEVAKVLLEHGASVNALDGEGSTALMLAVRAATNSYWKERRSPEWIEPLLGAGATVEGVEIPTGYDEADELLRRYSQ
jgi:ankyrin repeat protein